MTREPRIANPLGQLQGVQQYPGPVPGENVEGAVGEIGYALMPKVRLKPRATRARMTLLIEAVDEGARSMGEHLIKVGNNGMME